MATLNVRGLVNPAKRALVFSQLRRRHFDIVCLQETHCSSAPQANFWTQQWGGRAFWTVHRPDKAGTAILINKHLQHNISDVEVDTVAGRFVNLTVAIGATKLKVCGVYAPSIPAERRTFFSECLDRSRRATDNSGDDASLHVILGDFNCVENVLLDRVHSSAQPTLSDGFADLLAWTTSVDTRDVWRKVNPGKRATTWRNARTGSRLDRIYISATLVKEASADIVHVPVKDLDHDAATCILKYNDVERGKGYWKMNAGVLNQPSYRRDIVHLINDLFGNCPDHDLAKRWDVFKGRVRTFTMNLCSAQQLLRGAQLRHAEKDHADALQAWTADPTDVSSARLSRATAELDALNQRVYAAAALRSRAKYLVEGERPTKFFCALERQRQREQSICELEHPVTKEVATAPADLCAAAAAFYEKLYTPEATSDAAATEQLLQHLPSLSEDQAARCDSPFTLAELKLALDHSPSDKTPGLDGIPVEFYKTFWPVIGPILLRLFSVCVAAGELPTSCRQGAISMLFKKGDRTKLGNYRPLTMITADTKLLSKALSMRLDSVISSVVHTDQTGFVRGRLIHDNVLLLRAVREHSTQSRARYAVAFLDQEKAFDRVDWSYRDKVLARFGFGPMFMRVVHTLHKDISASVFVNGFKSRAFPVWRGTRQGDPFSPGLFALLDEPFACAVRADPLYAGIPIPDSGRGRAVKLSQFADDKAMYLGSNADCVRLSHHLKVYEAASGAKVNLTKSNALLLGRSLAPQWPDLPFHILAPGESTKYLGFKVGPDYSDRDMWVELLAKLNGSLSLYSKRSLSQQGRITVIQTLATSALWYFASITSPPDDVLKLIDDAIFRFLWRGKDRGVISREATHYPQACGGLGFPSTVSRIQSLQLTWLKRLFGVSDSHWQAFFLNSLRISPFPSAWGLGLRALVSDLDWLSRSQRVADVLPPLWHHIITTAVTLGFQEQAPTSAEDVLRQHLFYNSSILHDGQSLGSASWFPIARSGITHVRHLYDPFSLAPRSAEELNITDAAYNIVFSSIPQTWKNILSNRRAPLRPGDWIVTSYTNPPTEVLRVAEVGGSGRLFCDSFVCKDDGTFSPDPSGSIIATSDAVLRAHVIPHIHGHLVEGALDVMDALPEQLLIKQQAGNSAKFVPLHKSSARGTYAALMHKYKVRLEPHGWSSDLSPSRLRWPRIWKWVRSAHRDHSIRDFLWSLLHRRLSLGIVRAKYTKDGINCPACPDVLESFAHFVHDCPVVAASWVWFDRFWLAATGQHFPSSLFAHILGSLPPSRISRARRGHWLVRSVLHGEFLYTLWLQRCRAVMDKDLAAFTTAAITAVFKDRAVRSLNTLALVERYKRLLLPLIDKFTDALTSV